MTDNSGKDRRRNFNGRIDTLGTGTNGVSRRGAGQFGSSRDNREEENDIATAPLAEEEAPERDESDASEETDTDEAEDADDSEDSEDAEETELDAESDDNERFNGVTPEADVGNDGDEEDEEEETEAEDAEDNEHIAHEERSEIVDKRASLEIELDPFVRAFAARRAAESGDESLDEYIVGSVKGYLAGLLGGDVSSPGLVEREVDVEADEIFGGLLDTIADQNQLTSDVVIDAVAKAYDVPVDEDSLVVAGLRDHEALLNGVVANGSNELDDISAVVQAAVETRLIEEPA
jgi:hypothetical protein